MDLLPRAEHWVPGLGVALSAALGWALAADERAELAEDAQARADVVAEVVERRVEERARILDRLALDLRRGVAADEVRADAAETVADHPDILAIAATDGSAPVWVEPLSEVAPFAGSGTQGPWARLFDDRGSARLALGAAVRVDEAVWMLNHVEHLAEVGVGSADYALTLREGARTVYREPGGDRVAPCAISPAGFGPLAVEVEVCPRRAHASTLLTPLPELAFAAGAGLSLLAGRVLVLARVARRRAWEAEHALGELATFTYAVSHDFRAPVRALDAYSRILRDEGPQLDPEVRNYLDRISANALHIGALVDGILELARIAQAEVRVAAVDVSRLAEEEFVRLRTAAPGEEMDLVVTPGVVVRGDEALVRLVLRELLANAWTATRAISAPRVEVGLANVKGRKAVYVRDNGPGFDMTFAAQLFRPFQRTAAAAAGEGLGLGLALAHTATRRMGGRLWAEATPDAGATFWFVLPRRKV
ncbi:MAG: ATP-binding protein [Pseudomonadota bacterium]|nr:ATP-binding protein [Pseudomonadota bacterium]